MLDHQRVPSLQRGDPVVAMGGACDPVLVRIDGVLDAKPFSDLASRAVELPHGRLRTRRAVLAGLRHTLRAIGYDDVLSIEHEDEYMDLREGSRRVWRS